MLNQLPGSLTTPSIHPSSKSPSLRVGREKETETGSDKDKGHFAFIIQSVGIKLFFLSSGNGLVSLDEFGVSRRADLYQMGVGGRIRIQFHDYDNSFERLSQLGLMPLMLRLDAQSIEPR